MPPQERDSDVALESCEFWCVFCEAELPPEYFAVLQEFVPQLIPVLLTNMAYADDDEARHTAHVRDYCSPKLTQRRTPAGCAGCGGGGAARHTTRPRPRYQAVRAPLAGAPAVPPQCARVAASHAMPSQVMGGGTEDGEADGEEEGEDEEEASAWTLRKSSASSLDVLSTLFPDDLLPVMLPIVQVWAATTCARAARKSSR